MRNGKQVAGLAGVLWEIRKRWPKRWKQWQIRGKRNNSRFASRAILSKINYMDTRSDQPQKLKREYDSNFRVTQEYRDSLPDVQNSGSSDMQGANVPILQVGISGFRLPLRFVGPDGENLTLESKVTGTVSLDADKKGINMSRIIRIFYEYETSYFLPKPLSVSFATTRTNLIPARLGLKWIFPIP